LGAAPATGKRVRVEGLIFDRVVGGRVAERWEQWDQPAMLHQLGFA
jgi:predicted ester cyclase